MRNLLGSAWDREAQKRAKPADFGVLMARLGFLFGTGVKKIALRRPVGCGADALSLV